MLGIRRVILLLCLTSTVMALGSSESAVPALGSTASAGPGLGSSTSTGPALGSSTSAVPALGPSFRDVETEQGPVRGYNSDDAAVYSFYGIPYATAPRGEDKFKAPLPPQNRTEIFNATERNIICPQRPIHSDTFLRLKRTIDCLRINIFTPDTNGKLPVMLYIHGGAFQEGYGMIFSPVSLASTGQVVAVNINYRVGVHGFLCLGTDFAPGNAGFKDQVAALRWVKRNIRNFGGDPDEVLLAGSSSGSSSAELQMLSPMANGLFKRVALESNSALASIITDMRPLETATRFAKYYGVDTNQDIQKLDRFYRSLSDDQLNNGYVGSGLDIGFKLCLEQYNVAGVEKFLEKHPVEIVKSGNYEKRKILAGFSTMEGLLFIQNYNAWKPIMESNLSQFLPTDLMYTPEIAKKIQSFFPTNNITYEAFTDFFTDTLVAYPMLLSARLHTQNSVKVFMYVFSYNGTINLPPVSSSPIWGPGHVAESLYLQRYDDETIYDKMTKNDTYVAEYMKWMYLDYLRYGAPNARFNTICNKRWLPVTKKTIHYLKISNSLNYPIPTSTSGPLNERLDFWEEIFDASAVLSQGTESESSILISINSDIANSTTANSATPNSTTPT